VKLGASIRPVERFAPSRANLFETPLKLDRPRRLDLRRGVERLQQLAYELSPVALGELDGLFQKLACLVVHPRKCKPAALRCHRALRRAATRTERSNFYKLVERGGLAHVWVSNAIRISSAGLTAYLGNAP